MGDRTSSLNDIPNFVAKKPTAPPTISPVGHPTPSPTTPYPTKVPTAVPTAKPHPLCHNLRVLCPKPLRTDLGKLSGGYHQGSGAGGVIEVRKRFLKKKRCCKNSFFHFFYSTEMEVTTLYLMMHFTTGY